MEMNAILHQKELENAHQKGLMGMENPMMYPGMQANPMAFRGRQRHPEGHDVFVHRTTLDDLQANSLLMSTSPYPPISSLQRERSRRVGRRAPNHKTVDSNSSGPKGPSEDKSVDQSPGGASGEEKETEGKGVLGGDTSDSKPHQVKMDTELVSSNGRKSYKEGGEQGLRKACISSQDVCSDVTNCSSSVGDKDMPNQCSAFQEKFMFPAGPLATLPYMFPMPGNGLMPSGEFSQSKKTLVKDVRIIIAILRGKEGYSQKVIWEKMSIRLLIYFYNYKTVSISGAY